MVFDSAIHVKAKEYDPLAGLNDSDLPSQLNLRVNDLRQIENSIKQEYGNIFPANVAYVTPGTPRQINQFSMATPHGRAIYSKNLGINDDPFPTEEVFAAKGSGYNLWRSDDQFIFNKTGNDMRYPIIEKKLFVMDTHRIWGGMTRDYAELEYRNALVLNAIIKRHDLPQAVYTPLKVLEFEELPVENNNIITNLSIGDFNHDVITSRPKDYKLDGYISVPELALGNKNALVEYLYVGESVHVRVPPQTKKLSGQRFYFNSILDHGSIEEKETKIENFVKTVAPVIKQVHKYGITFSEENITYISSLTGGNISIAGVICDLDTVRFDVEGDELDRLQYIDKESIMKTIFEFSNLFKEEKLDSTNILAETALETFNKIYSLEDESLKGLWGILTKTR